MPRHVPSSAVGLAVPRKCGSADFLESRSSAYDVWVKATPSNRSLYVASDAVSRHDERSVHGVDVAAIVTVPRECPTKAAIVASVK